MKLKCSRNSSADCMEVAAAVNVAAVQLLLLPVLLLLLPVLLLLLLLLIAAAVAEVQLACQLTRF